MRRTIRTIRDNRRYRCRICYATVMTHKTTTFLQTIESSIRSANRATAAQIEADYHGKIRGELTDLAEWDDEQEVIVYYHIVPAESKTRDYPGAAAYIEIASAQWCDDSSELSPQEFDYYEATLIAAAEAEEGQ